MLKLQPENVFIDIPDLNRFRIGDHVIADACAEFDRHEGIVVGIEFQRLHGSHHLVPSITLLHDGYLTDGFKPIDLRKVDPTDTIAVTPTEAKALLYGVPKHVFTVALSRIAAWLAEIDDTAPTGTKGSDHVEN